jgi:hypothetical protein
MSETISLSTNSRFKAIAKILESKEKKSYFVIALTAISIMLTVVFGILPSYSAVTFQSSENIKRNEISQRIEKKISDLQKLAIELDNNILNINKIEKLVPNSLSQDIIFNEINSLISSNNLVLKSISFTPDSKTSSRFINLLADTTIKSMGVNIVIESDNNNYIDFVKKLEEYPRFFDIKSIVVSRSSSVSKGIFYQIVVQANYYYLNK